MKHLAPIDGLRAVAVLAVIAYHAGGELLQSGFVGVDVFFVISGYLITSLLANEWAQTGRIDLPAFYARRFRRILPALVVIVLATLAASYFLLSPIDEQRDTAHAAAASLLFAGNVFFQATTGGYFDSATEARPLLHLWSLGVEEQFYFLWPAVLILALRFKAARSVVVVLSVASFALAQWWLSTNAEAAFFQMPARFWELGIGAAIALSPRRAAGSLLLAYAGLSAVVYATAASTGAFPGVGALPAVLGAAALIYAVHGGGDLGLAGRFLSSRPMVAVGLVSYSLYLWHWPLLELDRAHRLGLAPVGVRCALMALAGVLAWLSYRLIETPFRKWRPHVTRFQVIRVGVAASLAVCASATAMAYFGDRGRVVNPLAVQAANDKPPRMAQCYYDDPLPAVIPRKNCANPGPVDVVIWGDSFAFSWMPFAQSLGNATSLSRSGCPPLIGYPGRLKDERHEGCVIFHAEALAYARTMPTVVLAAYWQDYDSAAMTGLSRTLDALDRVPRVIVLGPIPSLPREAPRCIQYRLNCTVSRADFDASVREIEQSLRTIVRRHPNVTFIDPADFFCTPECGVLRDGVPLYYDSHHVSATAARMFRAPQLAPRSATPLAR